MANARYFMADFETTVYTGQKRTDVWASGICEFFTENASIQTSIEDFFSYIYRLKGNLVIYFHNLKFDGNFILNYLLQQKWIQHALDKDDGGEYWIDKKVMRNGQIKYAISDRGQWYNIILKQGYRYIEFRDSTKLLPYSVKQLGKDFNTKHQKLEIEYKGYRKPGGNISIKEREYLKNDLYVVKEVLEIMFTEGYDKLTIGSCCMSDFKSIFGKYRYDDYFPNLYKLKIDSDIAKTQGDFILKSYKGGFCYLTPEKSGKILHNGVTLDVNSLYPYKMHSMSRERYPIGRGNFCKGPLPNKIKDDPLVYYFIRIKCKFHVKHGFLPFIQIKCNCHYRATDHLSTSDIYGEDGKYHDTFVDLDGTIKPAIVDMILTKDDYELFLQHYDTKNLDEIEYLWFDTDIGMFDQYIDKWRTVKQNNEGAKRGIAKLFSNNLYGQMAKSTDSSFKIAYFKDNVLKFRRVEQHKKQPGYIACGSAITSKARRYTIMHAQQNYHGDKPGFCYSDTDSIHMDIPADQIKYFDLDKKAYGFWDLELEWDKAYFARQKTYIESYIDKDNKRQYKVTCAGMPDRCKDLFIKGIKQADPVDKIERDFLLKPDGSKKSYDISSLCKGFSVPGKLRPKSYPGGIVLEDTEFTYR